MNRRSSAGRNCDYRNMYYLERVRAHMAFFEEDYETVVFRAEAAILALEDQHRSKGLCYGHREWWRIPELATLRAKAMAADGRLLEAEAELRVHIRVDRRRVFNATSTILLEQNRAQDALLTAHASLLRSLQPCSGFVRAESREAMTQALMVTGRWDEARRQYDAIAEELTLDPKTWRGRFATSIDYGILLSRTGDPETALGVFDGVAARRSALFSADNQAAVEARALRGLALVAMNRKDEALAVFQEELPVVIANWHDAVSQKVLNATPLWRLRLMASDYLKLLLDRGDSASVSEAFTIADTVNGRGIQRAFQASIARILERENADQGPIRSLQDTERAIEALSRQLVAEAGRYGDVDGVRGKLRTAEAALRTLSAEVERRYPAYKSLVNPDPVSVAEIQAILSADEALLLTFVADDATYVWAVPNIGAIKSAVVPLGKAELQDRVADLRTALAPEAVRTLGDIPNFDVRAAHELYEALLEPVKAGWGNAQRLILVLDGPLGSLPFGVLVTEDVKKPPNRGLLFDGYREVPWLIKEVNLSRVPSVSALMTLRRKLKAQVAGGRPFVGFGDPVFGGPEEEETGTRGSTEIEIAQRGITLRAGPGTRAATSADLSKLRRLPETSDEITAIAEALGADLSRDVYLREAATEGRVKSLSKAGTLANYNVISFATHGLVPGDLDGLRRPALALSVSVEGEEEDGLLTTDDMIGLNLDADWVVLSACNTGADGGNGADAVSGLGRAFFYAGARALLVSNWPVHSEATKDLMVTLFRLHAEIGGSKAGALRRAMEALIAEGAYKDDTGKDVFAYAHPLFWAPFTLVGDGGSARLVYNTSERLN